ncbi:MAG: hypothetical protein WBE63_13290, partial [Acidobacteriaceae bacterium]
GSREPGAGNSGCGSGRDAVKADARSDLIQYVLQSRLVRGGQQERTAPSHQVNVVSLGVGNRVIHDGAVPAHILQVGECQNAIRIGQ